MRLNRFAFSALALLVGALGPGLTAASAQPGGYYQDRDDAPREWNQIQRQGFHDGMEGAHRDYDNHRNPNPENRDEFRNPNLPPDQARLYREGFRRGYNVAASRLWGNNYGQQAPPQAAYNPGYNWGPAPDEFSALQRQGYQDGLVGAQRDWDNHRNPTPENRDEFRSPNLPPDQAQAYREGFSRGYAVAASRLWGAQVVAPPRALVWNMAPDGFSDVQQRGFQDGMVGAQRDLDNHRNPDPNNRDEFRSPHVPYQYREAYRDGFRRGYWRAINHLMGRPWQY
jgi:ribosome modulation factor